MLLPQTTLKRLPKKFTEGLAEMQLVIAFGNAQYNSSMFISCHFSQTISVCLDFYPDSYQVMLLYQSFEK